MAKYAGEYSETFVVDVPIDRAKKHFIDLDAIARNYGGVQSSKKVKKDTLRLTLEPRTEIGVTFSGEHTCHWEYAADGALHWKSIGKSNMASHGTAIFHAVSKKQTRIEYFEHIECDMEVNFLVARLIGPIVSRQIRDGVKSYLERMRAELKPKK